MSPRLSPRLLAGLLFILGLAACTTPPPAAPRNQLLILISIDGFRWDYLQKYDAPTLRALARDGVHATRMTSSFPSKTFPNHYTLVTGLYPAHHGIVGNEFFDPAFNETFSMGKPASNKEERWWAAGEPAWITAEKQGVRSACYFWPGSEVENHGLRPSRFKPFDGKIPTEQRVDELLGWLTAPAAERPRFCTLYFDIVDHAGHTFGPDAPETGDAVRRADAAIARLLAGLERLGLRDHTSLVIVSDHGMSEQGPDRVIFLEDLMDVARVRVESTGPTGGVRPKPGTGTAAELAAHIRAKAPPQLHVWLRDETPERFHYRGNPRIPDVVLIPDDHWNIESRVGWPNRVLTYNKGSHGWDPALANMGALFIASGPAFKHGVEIPDVDNIHVYNLLCAALGIKPAPNDGDRRLVKAALAR
ncbi:ectonucleotide pyrophosphatase/phosphodiesterase [Opitutus sp. GAS368]|uniref:alkaline phosphatase family protein n=1 Tax=Opitutus sp. GAS368 TaxID=1882749 RepID=UPI00087AB4D3|nr:ectonucleotide pyrophosphatase/phosphodiesterase [Opitutus sp. GAS368]SDR91896.1 Predicted pyrophosphatase or phosphodiesterase, AlkP superfamily [Opitutus sp. GAS368]